MRITIETKTQKYITPKNTQKNYTNEGVVGGAGPASQSNCLAAQTGRLFLNLDYAVHSTRLTAFSLFMRMAVRCRGVLVRRLAMLTG
jgi:hypothetical protein